MYEDIAACMAEGSFMSGRGGRYENVRRWLNVARRLEAAEIESATVAFRLLQRGNEVLSKKFAQSVESLSRLEERARDEAGRALVQAQNSQLTQEVF